MPSYRMPRASSSAARRSTSSPTPARCVSVTRPTSRLRCSYANGCVTRKQRSSISAFSPQTPMRSASGVSSASVSCASTCWSASDTPQSSRLRSSCRRTASAASVARASSRPSSISRIFSSVSETAAWSSSGGSSCSLTRTARDMRSASSASPSPTLVCRSCGVVIEWSSAACSMPAATVSSSRPMRARISATARHLTFTLPPSGATKRPPAVSTRWPSWTERAKTYARATAALAPRMGARALAAASSARTSSAICTSRCWRAAACASAARRAPSTP
mmetsp:Transcript_15513/g.48235  ORF Transcript_15513/g.48235 Transcript_15513/m.48235 type:complete len:277 (-) Transcript_15513:1020-1850(-)